MLQNTRTLTVSLHFSLKKTLVIKNKERQSNGEILLSGRNVTAPLSKASSRSGESSREEPRISQGNADMCNCVFRPQEFPAFQGRRKRVLQAGKYLPPTTTVAPGGLLATGRSLEHLAEPSAARTAGGASSVRLREGAVAGWAGEGPVRRREGAATGWAAGVTARARGGR